MGHQLYVYLLCFTFNTDVSALVHLQRLPELLSCDIATTNGYCYLFFPLPFLGA